MKMSMNLFCFSRLIKYDQLQWCLLGFTLRFLGDLLLTATHQNFHHCRTIIYPLPSFVSLIDMSKLSKIVSDLKIRLIKNMEWKIMVFQEVVLYACTLLGPLATVAYVTLANKQNKRPESYQPFYSHVMIQFFPLLTVQFE